MPLADACQSTGCRARGAPHGGEPKRQAAIARLCATDRLRAAKYGLARDRGTRVDGAGRTRLTSGTRVLHGLFGVGL